MTRLGLVGYERYGETRQARRARLILVRCGWQDRVCFGRRRTFRTGLSTNVTALLGIDGRCDTSG